MKKIYNVIFPVWLIFLMPPIILFVIPSNFIIDSVALIIGFKILKINGMRGIYKNCILKVWGFGFLADIIGALILLATQFMGSNDFLYENLIAPVVANPFSNPLSLIYTLFAILVSGHLIYLLNYRFSFRKTELDKTQKKKLSVLLAVITSPYLFLLPTTLIYQFS